MNNKAQAVMEFSLVFLMVAALIMGILGLWEWSKDNIPERQGAFENSRIQAGTKTSPGEPEVPFGAETPPQPDMF